MEIGDKVKLNEQFFSKYRRSKQGMHWQKAKSRRMRIIKFLSDEIVRVQRVGEYMRENYWIGFLTLADKKIERDERIAKLARTWCQWNRKELKDGDFAYLFGQLYEAECLEEWNG